LSKNAAHVWPQLMARHPGDPLELDDKLGVDERLAVHPVGDRLLWPSDRTSEGGLTAHAAAGVRHGLAHAAFLGFGGHPIIKVVWEAQGRHPRPSQAAASNA